MNEKIAGRPPCYFFMPVTKDNVLYSSYFNWHNSIEYSTIPLYLKNKLWMGIKVYKSCFQRVAGWCEAIEVVRWHSPVSFDGECSSSHRRWFRYTRNESQLGWYRVMYITPLWVTIVALRGFFYTVKCWSEPPPAGSDFGLRPSQGQSRFFSRTSVLCHLELLRLEIWFCCIITDSRRRDPKGVVRPGRWRFL